MEMLSIIYYLKKEKSSTVTVSYREVINNKLFVQKSLQRWGFPTENSSTRNFSSSRINVSYRKFINNENF